MGLDIHFNKEQAINAGLVIAIMPNGTAEEIAEETASEYADQEYIAWLAQERQFIQVPNCNPVFYTEAQDSEQGDLIVRANKWGRVYAPLTDWLLANKIDWLEF